MQKRAFSQYEAFFAPLPVKADEPIFFDQHSIGLPFAEDFPKLHYHDRYEIGICESGEGLFLCEGRYSSVSAGDLIFVAPQDRHYSRSLHKDELCRCRFLYVSADAVNAALGEKARWELGRAVPTVIRRDEHPNAAHELAAMLRICRENTSDRELLICLRLASFLLEYGRSFLPPTESFANEKGYKEHSAAEKAAEYISLHYSESQSAGELAKLCHLSESQLRRRFTQVYGLAPIAYRNRLRCRVGAELLLRTGLSVGDISERIGYSATSDFYRAFRANYGCSPSEYRRKG